MDRLLYNESQKRKHLEYEALCKRCGACCGAKEGNPCELPAKRGQWLISL